MYQYHGVTSGSLVSLSQVLPTDVGTGVGSTLSPAAGQQHARYRAQCMVYL
eukprot:m.66421 g.66421  ORF g.66421 m.66421 type:complete len:51 (+) comp7623_c0_seq1:33-185(+)